MNIANIRGMLAARQGRKLAGMEPNPLLEAKLVDALAEAFVEQHEREMAAADWLVGFTD